MSQITEALKHLHPERKLCNCQRAYSPDGVICPSGCSANSLAAKEELAKGYLVLVAKRVLTP